MLWTNELLTSLRKSAIQLIQVDEQDLPIGSSKFGGLPHVPVGFQWPYFDGIEGEIYYVEKKNRPLSFLAQFNLEEVAQFDEENLLPKKGFLYFFYELETMCWGIDVEKEKDCFRVIYLDVSVNELQPLAYPIDLNEMGRIPEVVIELNKKVSMPSFEEVHAYYLEEEDYSTSWDTYHNALEQNGFEKKEDETEHQLLGYANVIQGCVQGEIEIATQNIKELYRKPPEEQKRVIEASKDWILLFQMGTVQKDNYWLMFGDCGQLYFYIKENDLKNLRFDRCWISLQCA